MGEKYLALIPNASDSDVVSRIVWREGLPGTGDEKGNEAGTEATEKACMDRLQKFLQGHETQWELNNGNEVHSELWCALTGRYKYPVLKNG